MGDFGDAASGFDKAYWDQREVIEDRAEAVRVGATAPAPPVSPVCPECGLMADRFPTYSEAWVLLEPLDPVEALPSHFVPPGERWMVDGNGVAWNAGDAEPAQGAVCRIAHRLACPGLEPVDLWRWLTAVRAENARKAQRLFNPPRLPEPPEVGETAGA
ncbi:DUF6083 domain-containing protein [Streptomyces sp. NBC_01373]|uniref:DUF6083 domain-containing protein n=1 Tax=Streptomyces sp. NBC_01373 TaxID=2903843 RepID=UPI00225ADD81|nr:DUF6083 domain-containing protein [Streptomyces sp. NBC_01373]MCX4706749.1 DUF6083 domain-containing protein [Streptomyces sp. NBC_01373]